MSVPNTFASATSAIPLANLDADFAYYDAAFQISGTAMAVNYTFRLEDVTDNTKIGEFVLSGITTGTTRQYTLPNVSGALATLGNLAQTFAGTVKIANTFQATDATDTTKVGQFGFANIPTGTTVTYGFPSLSGTLATLANTSQTFAGATTFSNTLTVSSTFSATGTTATLGSSTAASTLGIGTGATIAAATKTVNIGTAGVSTSITNINIGSAVSGATGTTLNSNNVTFAKLQARVGAAPTIASAATIAPTTQIAFVSGTTTIDTITAPSPISLGGGTITLIPTGIFTTSTAGNIALASVSIVSRALTMTYDVTTAKWYPSY